MRRADSSVQIVEDTDQRCCRQPAGAQSFPKFPEVANQAFDSDSRTVTAKSILPRDFAIGGSPVGRLSAQDCRSSAALAIDPSHQRGRYCRPYRRYRLGFVKQKREEQNCAKSGN